MKRIAHIISTGEISGAEKIAIEICENFNNKYKMIYICKEGSIKEELEQKNIEYRLYKNTIDLIKILMIEKFDILHAHDFRASIISSLLKLSKAKIISHIHCSPKFIKYINFKSTIYYLSTLLIDKIIVVSENIEENFYFRNKLLNKIEVVNNWVRKNEEFSSLKKDIDLLFVGRLVYEKNPFEFLEVVEMLVKNNKNIKAKILGRGYLKEELEKCIQLKNLSNNVECLGFKSNSQYYMKRSKVLFVPSLEEGFGLVYLEAFLNECVPVGNRVGGLKDIFPIDYRYINNTNRHLENILEILEDTNTKDLFCKYNFIGKEFNFEKSMIKIEHIYEQ